MKTTVPLVYWSGYSTPVLVSASFIGHWSVKVSESPVQRVFPRRWLDTEGRKIGEFWEAALKAVLGLVIFRPGISQVCGSHNAFRFSRLMMGFADGDQMALAINL